MANARVEIYKATGRGLVGGPMQSLDGPPLQAETVAGGARSAVCPNNAQATGEGLIALIAAMDGDVYADIDVGDAADASSEPRTWIPQGDFRTLNIKPGDKVSIANA